MVLTGMELAGKLTKNFINNSSVNPIWSEFTALWLTIAVICEHKQFMNTKVVVFEWDDCEMGLKAWIEHFNSLHSKQLNILN